MHEGYLPYSLLPGIFSSFCAREGEGIVSLPEPGIRG